LESVRHSSPGGALRQTDQGKSAKPGSDRGPKGEYDELLYVFKGVGFLGKPSALTSFNFLMLFLTPPIFLAHLGASAFSLPPYDLWYESPGQVCSKSGHHHRN
jgi:hypothetical protein